VIAADRDDERSARAIRRTTSVIRSRLRSISAPAIATSPTSAIVTPVR